MRGSLARIRGRGPTRRTSDKRVHTSAQPGRCTPHPATQPLIRPLNPAAALGPRIPAIGPRIRTTRPSEGERDCDVWLDIRAAGARCALVGWTPRRRPKWRPQVRPNKHAAAHRPASQPGDRASGLQAHIRATRPRSRATRRTRRPQPRHPHPRRRPHHRLQVRRRPTAHIHATRSRGRAARRDRGHRGDGWAWGPRVRARSQAFWTAGRGYGQGLGLRWCNSAVAEVWGWPTVPLEYWLGMPGRAAVAYGCA